MADRVTTEQRSRNMREVKSKNTSPEIYFRKLLFSEGFRYRVHSSNIPGHPDVWLARYNTAIFVHGCFWHQHKGCKRATIPQTRTEFWQDKFKRNCRRDEEVRIELNELNIKCLIVWECTIKRMRSNPDIEKQEISEIISFIKTGEGCTER